MEKSPEFATCISVNGVIFDIDGFTREIVHTDLYWVLLVTGEDWKVVVDRLLTDLYGWDRAAPDAALFLEADNKVWPAFGALRFPAPIPTLYTIKKSTLPVAELSRRLNVPPKALKSGGIIQLLPTEEMEKDDQGAKSNLAPELRSYSVH